MKLLLKRALLLPLILVPVLAMAGGHAVRGGGFRGYSGHNEWRGPARVIRPHVGAYSAIGLGIGLGVGYGIGYSAFGAPYYGYPYSSWYYGPPREVIVEHNTYVEQPSERVYTSRPNETSLLRDLQGRCYERTYDRNGNELRTELDPAECNF